MSFYGFSFSYDGISCEEFGLMLYDFNNVSQGDSEYAKGFVIQEDRVPRQHRSMYYGSYYKNALEFTLVFGVGQRASTNREPIDRQQMEVVAMWLTGTDGYKQLSIDQPDMREYFYNCIITDLKTIEYAGDKWAFSCKVKCDSPYAYTYPETFAISAGTATKVNPYVLFNRSTCNELYSPKVKITFKDTSKENTVKIINHSNGAKETTLTNLPTSVTWVEMDAETGVLKDSANLNIYNKFNFEFPRLVPGDNKVEVVGNCDVEFTCEFPVNIGG